MANKQIKYSSNFYFRNKPRIQAYQEKYSKRKRRELRISIFEVLGFKCSRCDYDDIRALQIDHINGGGLKESRKAGSSINYYKMLLNKILSGSKEYQILCANCNWIKRHERGEQPPGKKSS